jgi:hypothetical protein
MEHRRLTVAMGHVLIRENIMFKRTISPKSEIPDWRKIFSWTLLFVGAVFGLVALLWPNHRQLWAFAGGFAFSGVIARYVS